MMDVVMHGYVKIVTKKICKINKCGGGCLKVYQNSII